MRNTQKTPRCGLIAHHDLISFLVHILLLGTSTLQHFTQHFSFVTGRQSRIIHANQLGLMISLEVLRLEPEIQEPVSFVLPATSTIILPGWGKIDSRYYQVPKRRVARYSVCSLAMMDYGRGLWAFWKDREGGQTVLWDLEKLDMVRRRLETFFCFCAYPTEIKIRSHQMLNTPIALACLNSNWR